MNSRITYADVASTLALVVAIFGGGVAVASSLPKLPKDSVTSKQVKNGTLEGKDIDDNAITGPKIDEASLGKVPSAASADRAASADQAAEVDTVRHVAASLTAGLNDSTMLHSGPFTVSLTCNPFGNPRSFLRLGSSEPGLARVSTNGGPDQNFALDANAVPSFVAGPANLQLNRVEVTAMAGSHTLYLTGMVSESGGRCAADILALG